MGSLEAILVDFDGTLVNSEVANAKAYEASLQEYGFKIPKEIILESCIGRHWSKFLPELLRDNYSQNIALKIAKNKRVIYSNFYNEITLNKPLFYLLKQFHNLPKALVTNASKESVLPILDQFEIKSFFSVIICQEDVAAPKPSPDGYLLAISRLGANKQNCLAIEDSMTGVQAAKDAGIPTLRISPFIG
jgi:beta-phosphoglucomutase